MSRCLYLGVDAGNSKTDALVVGDDGEVMGWGRSGCGDIYGAATPGAAVDAVVAAIESALHDAEVHTAEISGTACRLAGVDWLEDEAFWQATLAERLPELAHVSVANDGFAPIRCVEPSGVGVAIVAGTGPAVAGRGPAGAEWSICFWVQEGIGADAIGHAGLRAVFRSATGLGPTTALTDAMLAAFGLDDVERLLHHITARGRPPVRRGTLAPLVTDLAARGDPVAIDIVETQAALLADYARVVADRVGFDSDADRVPIVLAGSVLIGSPPVVGDALVVALSHRLPHARVERVPLPPVFGAVLDAMAESGRRVTPQIMAMLQRSNSARGPKRCQAPAPALRRACDGRGLRAEHH